MAGFFGEEVFFDSEDKVQGGEASCERVLSPYLGRSSIQATAKPATKIADSMRTTLGKRRWAGLNPTAVPFGTSLLIQMTKSTKVNNSAAIPPETDLTYITGKLLIDCCAPIYVVLASGISDEAVAYAADGDEVLGGGGVVFDVAAEADDEVVDGAGVGVFVDAPDLLEDVFTGDDLTLAVGEVAEEVGLHK